MPKILIIRFSSIGDIVLTTPVIRCLKLQLQAEVHFLTKVAYHSILIANPYLAKVYTIQKKVGEVLPDLQREGYDYVIDLHKNLRSTQVKFALSARSFSFEKLNWEKWLLVNFKIDKLPNIHIVDRYLKTVASLGIVNDGAGLDYFIPEKTDIGGISEIPPIYHSKTVKKIIFAIGAAHQTKRLPMEKIVEICAVILNRESLGDTSYLIALIGGPAEEEEGIQIIEKLEQSRKLHPSEGVINLCGKISLNQSAYLIQQADLVITHDTGMMHIAAALKKKIISIWGSTVPEFGMYPYYPVTDEKLERSGKLHPSKELPSEGVSNSVRHVIIENKDLQCRPCSKIGHAQCPKGHFNCMQQIDPQYVAETVKRLTKDDFYKDRDVKRST
ncbi:MAG: glycosyltransferase family 9 protein [Saprospiraceae bacterium]